MATVLVVDAAISVRETLRIVLGHEHDVVVAPSLAELPRDSGANVVVLGLPPSPRDDRALGMILERELSGVPLLVLHAAHDLDVRALVAPEVPIEFLPKPFDAYGIRACVRTLAQVRDRPTARESRGHPPRRYLEFPLVSQSTAAVLRRVMTADVPVLLLQGEPGTGVDTMASALHAVWGGRGTFIACDAGHLTEGDLAGRVTKARTDVATLYLAHLDQAPAGVQRDLLRLLDEGLPGRVVVGVQDDLGELAAAGRFLPELAYLVGTMPIVLAPLRDRTADVPALVQFLTEELCARLRLTAVTYQPEALERLQQYLWFGNVRELEAVLTRTLVLHRPTLVEADHLVFLPEGVPRAVSERTTTTRTTAPLVPPLPESDVLTRLDLEVVLGELAHELRNPMVTIKTVAQHLDGVLADPDARARFSALMAEAVTRMDGVLETLLDFSRFREPMRQPIDVERVLDRVLGERAEELAVRHVRVEHNGVGMGPVSADETQVLFAFRTLCGGLVSDLVPHTTITVRGAGPGVLEMHVRAEASIAARLVGWVEPRAAAAAETMPLSWALAATLLRRNGGELGVGRGEGETTVIRVAWTPQGGEDGEWKNVKS